MKRVQDLETGDIVAGEYILTGDVSLIRGGGCYAPFRWLDGGGRGERHWPNRNQMVEFAREPALGPEPVRTEDAR